MLYSTRTAYSYSRTVRLYEIADDLQLYRYAIAARLQDSKDRKKAMPGGAPRCDNSPANVEMSRGIIIH
jgi:hypothetical protein